MKIIKEFKDPNNTHKFTTKSCIEIIRDNLHRKGIILYYKNNPAKFNNFHFTNFCKYFSIKSNEKLCYVHKQFSSPQYSYSQQAIDFIIEELKKDQENILDKIKTTPQN